MARRKAERFPSWATVMEYVDSILEGRKIACPELVQACRRFKQDLENPAWDFNPRDAEFVIRIIETTFVHQQGERLDGTPLRGQPFLLEPFHKFIVYNLLGFFLAGTKIRMYIMSDVSNQVLLNIRDELYRHIQTLSFGFFDSRPTGKILIG